jgi:hypothetical protein
LSKPTTWTLRAAGLLLPLLCAAGADAMPGDGGYCTEVETVRTVWSAGYSWETPTSCFYSCTLTDRTEWTCWAPDTDPGPIPYTPAAASDAAAAAPGAESFTAGPGVVSCSWRIVTTGDASDTYTVTKEKSKGDGMGGDQASSTCEPSAPELCCEGWYGVCE